MSPPAPGKRPTIRDVASQAGVSIKTVSRVLNGEPGVKPGTAARVQVAIGDLGFRRNEIARLLRTGSVAAEPGPCPGCESLRHQCSELAGEVGFLAGVLHEIRNASDGYDPGTNEHATWERATRALDRLHAGAVPS